MQCRPRVAGDSLPASAKRTTDCCPHASAACARAYRLRAGLRVPGWHGAASRQRIFPLLTAECGRLAATSGSPNRKMASG